MKIIDLLNKIAKGEEVPNKIKAWSNIYEYREGSYADTCEYYDVNDDSSLTNACYFNTKDLNYEIEIIEEVEDKEYEDIDIINGDYVVPNTPATENEAYIMACFLAHEQIINALIRNQKYILEQLKNEK